MAQVYFVENKRTQEILNLKGGWSNSVGSYRLAEFDTEDAAKAAFPAGVDCGVRRGNRQEVTWPAPSTPLARAMSPAGKSPATKFFVRKGTKFLNKTDEFKAKTILAEDSASFNSQDEALDKVEALGVSLDLVHVVETEILVTA